MRLWTWKAFGASVLALGAAASLAGCSGRSAFGQPAAERQAQAALPRSDDPLWTLLGSTAVTEDRAHGAFAARFPQAVSALGGRTLTVSGFMLPLETKSETDHFLLSRNTPVCPFCPPGRPNEVIEVHASGPVVPDTDEITVTGRFALQHDAAAGLFFRLDGADVSG